MFIQILYAIFYHTRGDGNTRSLDESNHCTASLYMNEFSSVESQIYGEGEE